MAKSRQLRMMVVDDSAETRDYLRKLLQFEANIDLVGMAANGKDAVNLALELKPDLILMDINMPVMDGISAAEMIFREMPTIRVVMMSVQSEMAYLRRAMQAGAREFLIKPFTHDELLNILGEVSSLMPLPAETAAATRAEGMVAAPLKTVKRAALVVVFSPRGGAGCSTLSINLGVALQGQRKASVLVIDGNLRFGALDAMLNLQISHSITDLIESLKDADPELLHSTTLPHTSGIRLLAAPSSPEMADLVTSEHLERIIALGRLRYDYIVVDVGTSLRDEALSLMDMADRIIVVLTPDIPAIKNVHLFLQIAQGLNYDQEKVVLVLNRANPRGGIDAPAIERHLKHPILVSIPESPGVAQAAINRGVPLILYERSVHKGMPVTRQLLALVDAVPEPGEALPEGMAEGEPLRAAERVEPARTPEAKKEGFLGRVFGRRK